MHDGKDMNENWCGKLNYWECVFNGYIPVSLDIYKVFESLTKNKIPNEKRKTLTAPITKAYKAQFRKHILSIKEMYEMYECGIFITYHKMAKATYVNLSFKFNKSGAPIMLNNRPFCAYILNIHLVPPSESSFIVSNVSNSLGSMVNESKILLRNFANELSCNHFQCLNSQKQIEFKT